MLTGLKYADVLSRQKKYGYNELSSEKESNVFEVFLKVLSEPMLLLLLISSFIYFLLGSKNEALMLFSFVFVVIGITFYQEHKTQKTLQALKDLSSPRALVIRDGKQQRIAGREVVVDDLLIIGEGDRIPADAVLIKSLNLEINESLLTGESLSVRKKEWDGKKQEIKPGGDDLPFVFSGTMVISGHGIAKVISIGQNTQIGKIGKSLIQIKEEETLLKKEIRTISRYFLITGILLCFGILLLYFFKQGNFLDGFLYGLAVSMSMLPEEFPVVFAIFMALGAWRISKSNVLTRNPSAIETLGCATVLCVDKTGTLTQNRMELDLIFFDGEYYDASCDSYPDRIREVIDYAKLSGKEHSSDPIEKEMACLKSDNKNFFDSLELVKEYHFQKNLIATANVWRDSSEKYLICSKGMPETIIDLCKLDNSLKDDLLKEVENMSQKGYRVLGLAKGSQNSDKPLPESQRDFEYEFLGFLGFIDPIKESTTSALKEAYQANIRTIMITGDYPGTARFIAKEIGLRNYDNFITGDILEKMSQQELSLAIREINVFARVLPEQKLKIVNALKENNEIVAMTGDGVNDAPALKSAHIGIAMGQRGTDVAREASSLVLLDDDFCSIISAIKQGRTIFYNLRKAVSYIFSVHIPIAGMAFLPIIFNLPIVLLPAHIAFLELIIDPACSTIYEALPPDKDIMKRNPRNINEKLFDLETISNSFLKGLMVLLSVFLLFIFALKIPGLDTKATTLSFVALVLANLGLIIANISQSQNLIKILKSAGKPFYFIFVSAILFLISILAIPFLREIFVFDILNIKDIGILLFFGLFNILIFNIFKFKK